VARTEDLLLPWPGETRSSPEVAPSPGSTNPEALGVFETLVGRSMSNASYWKMTPVIEDFCLVELNKETDWRTQGSAMRISGMARLFYALRTFLLTGSARPCPTRRPKLHTHHGHQ
jgi:hypothetical protein